MLRVLKERLPAEPVPTRVAELGVELDVRSFKSRFRELAPAGNEYQGLSSMLRALLRYYLARNESSNTYLLKNLEVADEQVDENARFRYPVVFPQGCRQAQSVILLLHGLNERSWDKYLPWACRLSVVTGSAVILFPTAFHMNRAPSTWANPRLMHRIAQERKELFPDVQSSSFANAAISTRLQLVPQRLCYSGLQTLKDLEDLAAEIRGGRQPRISAAARIDVFGYSMGGMIGELLLLGGGEAFSRSRLLLFCGGATFDLSNPVSRLILDSEALHAISEFYGPGFPGRISQDERLCGLFARYSTEASAFSLLVSSGRDVERRCERFAGIRRRIRSISLGRDTVIPPASVARSLNGDGAPPNPLDLELDFPYEYIHEMPFPFGAGDLVDAAFEQTFAQAGEFLG